MRKPSEFIVEIRALTAGIVIGIGTNLLSARSGGWPAWLRPIDTWSHVWMPLFVLALLAAKVVGWRKATRRHPWTGLGNPYPGLQRYDADRAEVFFGRDREVQELTARIEDAGTAPWSRFVTVVGHSGVGKSSLVHAGVLPGIRRAAIVRLSFLSASPLVDLAGTLLPDASQAEIRQLRPEDWAAALTSARGGAERLLLVIDQLDDNSWGDPDHVAFMAVLWGALQADERVVVLATLRWDYLHAFEQTAPDEFTHPYVLGPPTELQLRRIVTEPFRAAARDLAPGLADQIVADASSLGALPLLSAALTRLFETRHEDVLSLDDYDATGRVSGVVAAQANAAVERLEPGVSLEAILDTLIVFVEWRDEVARIGRRRTRLSEFTTQQLVVVREFVEARLIVAGENETYEIAHDAVLSNWDPLRAAINAREPALRRLAEISAVAELWRRQPPEKQNEYLITGNRLRNGMRLSDEFPIPPFVQAFIEESSAAAHQAAGPLADRVARKAQRILDQPLARAVARAAVTDYRATPYASLTLTMHTPVLVHSLGDVPRPVSLAFSVDDRLAVRANDREVLLFAGPADTQPRRLRSPVRLGGGLAWYGDRLIANKAWGSWSDRDLVVWSASTDTGQRIKLPRVGNFAFRFDRGYGSELAVRDDGLIAESGVVPPISTQYGSSGSSMSAVRVWRWGASRASLCVMTQDTDAFNEGPVAFSPNNALAVGSTGAIRIWYGHEHHESFSLDMFGTTTALDWSADGQLAAVAHDKIYIWRTPGESEPLRLRHEGQRLGRIGWSAGGHLAVAADEGLHVWGPEQLQEREPRPVVLASFLPLGLVWSRQLHLAAVGRASASEELELRVWDVGADCINPEPPMELTREERRDYGLPVPAE